MPSDGGGADSGAAGPLVLGFDTSAAQCAAAIVSGQAVLARRVEPMARGHAERLVPMLEDVLAEAGAAWGDLAAVAVCTGPGNFTGIRIGVAAARGLALGLGVPAVGLTAFEVRSHAEGGRGTVAVRAQGRLLRQLMADGEPLAAADAVAGEEEPGPGGPGADASAAAPVDPAWIARAAAARLAAGRIDPHARPAPFYLRDADAAPAEAPPRMLDDDA